MLGQVSGIIQILRSLKGAHAVTQRGANLGAQFDQLVTRCAVADALVVQHLEYRMMPKITDKQAGNLVSAAQFTLCPDTAP